MRHVDHRQPARPQPADQREQRLGLVVGQRGGRLVEGDHLGVGGERPHDLDQLPLCGSEFRPEGVRIEVAVEAEAGQVGAHPLAKGRAVEQAARPARQRPEIDVLGDRHVRHDLRFLADHPDPGRTRVGRGGRCERDAVELEPAAVRAVVAAQDPDEGGLARAVLPHQRGHRAGGEVQAHVAQGGHPGEALAEAGGAQTGQLHGTPACCQVLESTIVVGAKASAGMALPFFR